MTGIAPPSRSPDAEPVRDPAPVGILRLVLIGLTALVALAILLALGFWQVERLRWKEGVVATIDARIHAEPLPLAEVEAIALRSGDVDYVPVRLRGAFLHSGERYFLATLNGQAGWHVYTPLLIEGRNAAVFVNRGFVPFEAKDPATRARGQVGGEVEITGLARNASQESAEWFVPANDPATGTFFTKNVAEMGENVALPPGTALLPFLVDAGPGAAPGGVPVGGVTVVEIPNNHLQYAVTWFGLAAVLVAMLGAFALHSLRARRGGAA